MIAKSFLVYCRRKSFMIMETGLVNAPDPAEVVDAHPGRHVASSPQAHSSRSLRGHPDISHEAIPDAGPKATTV
jgi:hypothetical protein